MLRIHIWTTIVIWNYTHYQHKRLKEYAERYATVIEVDNYVSRWWYYKKNNDNDNDTSWLSYYDNNWNKVYQLYWESKSEIFDTHANTTYRWNIFELPRGLEISFLEFIEELWEDEYYITYEERKSHVFPIERSDKFTKLRNYQQELSKILEDNRRGYIIVPTGGGKTIVMINDIIQSKEKTLVIIHTKQLMNQFIERLKTFSTIADNEIGIIWDGKFILWNVTVCLMQTLWKLSWEEIKELSLNFSRCYIDECHHLTATTFKHITRYMSTKNLYWLTATPDKSEWTARDFMKILIGTLLYQVTEETLESEWIILRPFLSALDIDIPIYDFLRDNFSKLESYQTIDSYTLISDPNLVYTLVNDYKIIVCLNSTHKQQITSLFKDKYYIVDLWIVRGVTPFRKYINNLDKTLFIVSRSWTEQVDMNKIKKQLYYHKKRLEVINHVCRYEILKKDELHKHNSDYYNSYILILCDEINHIESIYNSLDKELQDVTITLHGGLKKKELEFRNNEIDNKKYRIIIATSKLIGEGWDKSYLNTLIITQLMKDHEGLKQLVWRVVRSYDGKTSCRVYDLVDKGCTITWNQFIKRYDNYYKSKTNFRGIINRHNRSITYLPSPNM